MLYDCTLLVVNSASSIVGIVCHVWLSSPRRHLIFNLHTYSTRLRSFENSNLILSSFYSHQFEISCSFPPALSFSLSLQTNSTPFPIFHFDISWGEPLKRQFQRIKQLMSFGVSYVLLTAWCLRRVVLQCSFLLFLASILLLLSGYDMLHFYLHIEYVHHEAQFLGATSSSSSLLVCNSSRSSIEHELCMHCWYIMSNSEQTNKYMIKLIHAFISRHNFGSVWRTKSPYQPHAHLNSIFQFFLLHALLLVLLTISVRTRVGGWTWIWIWTCFDARRRW